MIEDVRLLIERALEELNIPVWAEELHEDQFAIPDEYIVYSVSSESFGDYADDKPISLVSNIRVNWIGKDLNLKTTRPYEIMQKMHKKGFRTQYTQGDILSEAGSGYYGFYQDYYIKRMIAHE